jgi:hypothetical protein
MASDSTTKNLCPTDLSNVFCMCLVRLPDHKRIRALGSAETTGTNKNILVPKDVQPSPQVRKTSYVRTTGFSCADRRLLCAEAVSFRMGARRHGTRKIKETTSSSSKALSFSNGKTELQAPGLKKRTTVPVISARLRTCTENRPRSLARPWGPGQPHGPVPQCRAPLRLFPICGRQRIPLGPGPGPCCMIRGRTVSASGRRVAAGRGRPSPLARVRLSNQIHFGRRGACRAVPRRRWRAQAQRKAVARTSTQVLRRP